MRKAGAFAPAYTGVRSVWICILGRIAHPSGWALPPAEFTDKMISGMEKGTASMRCDPSAF